MKRRAVRRSGVYLTVLIGFFFLSASQAAWSEDDLDLKNEKYSKPLELPQCGNGVKDQGEQCDTPEFDGCEHGRPHDCVNCRCVYKKHMPCVRDNASFDHSRYKCDGTTCAPGERCNHSTCSCEVACGCPSPYQTFATTANYPAAATVTCPSQTYVVTYRCEGQDNAPKCEDGRYPRYRWVLDISADDPARKGACIQASEDAEKRGLGDICKNCACSDTSPAPEEWQASQFCNGMLPDEMVITDRTMEKPECCYTAGEDSDDDKDRRHKRPKTEWEMSGDDAAKGYEDEEDLNIGGVF